MNVQDAVVHRGKEYQLVVATNDAGHVAFIVEAIDPETKISEPALEQVLTAIECEAAIMRSSAKEWVEDKSADPDRHVGSIDRVSETIFDIINTICDAARKPKVKVEPFELETDTIKVREMAAKDMPPELLAEIEENNIIAKVRPDHKTAPIVLAFQANLHQLYQKMGPVEAGHAMLLIRLVIQRGLMEFDAGKTLH